MRIGSVPAFFSPIFLNRALIEMCFYDSYPVFWEHSDLENPLQHQTSTTLLWLLRENPSTLPLSCSRCCVSTSTPKPRAEGSSPSAPAKKPAKTLGFRRFPFFMCCIAIWCILVRISGFPTRPYRLHPSPAPETQPVSPFSDDFGCVSLFLPSFDLQNFRLCFCASCRIAFTD